ncbi:hypothetical protein ACSQ67_021934 [Phaseolus vulgaris]
MLNHKNPRAVVGVTRCASRVREWRARAAARRGMEWEVFYWWCFRIQHIRSEVLSFSPTVRWVLSTIDSDLSSLELFLIVLM